MPNLVQVRTQLNERSCDVAGHQQLLLLLEWTYFRVAESRVTVASQAAMQARTCKDFRELLDDASV